jgi:Thiamine pyrophosphate enzyme, N-terminal TPP binding domain
LAAAWAVVPGPGLQNASAGIGTAYTASLPILVISGQIERNLIGFDRGMLHLYTRHVHIKRLWLFRFNGSINN